MLYQVAGSNLSVSEMRLEGYQQENQSYHLPCFRNLMNDGQTKQTSKPPVKTGASFKRK